MSHEKLSDLLFQNNLVGFGMKAQNLEDKILEATVSSGPICPKCETQMIPKTYIGYYDQFSHWACECSDLSDMENHQEEKGSYG